jgi:hypothetical protein
VALMQTKLVLTADTATIKNRLGNTLVYRKHSKPSLGPVGDSLDDLLDTDPRWRQ